LLHPPLDDRAVAIAQNEFGHRHQCGLNPLRRIDRPVHIADLLALIVSPAAKWMIGSCVRMDGIEINGICSPLLRTDARKAEYSWRGFFQ